MEVLGGALAKAFAIMAATVVVFLVFTLFWVRQTVRGKNYCFFIEPNNQISGDLLKEDESGTMMVGKDENAQKYKTVPKKQLWSFWPPGFPRFVQEPVPSYLYIRNQFEPVDPRQQEGIITAKQLRVISDEAMLKTTWKDVRETTGAPTGKFDWKILGIIALIILVAVSAWFAYQNSAQIKDLLEIFKTTTTGGK